MADEESGGGIWSSLAEFLCMLSPQQFLLLPTLLGNMIFCSTDEYEQLLISSFLEMLSTSIATISTQRAACKELCKSRRKEEINDAAAGQEQTDEADSGTILEREVSEAATPLAINIAHTLFFE